MIEKKRTNDLVFIIEAIIVPVTTPKTTNVPKVFIILKSTAPCFLWANTDENEVNIVIVNAVPTVDALDNFYLFQKFQK